MAKPPLNPRGGKGGDALDRTVQILSPKKQTLKIKGKISYSESSRAWNVIKIKKDILSLFPQLKDKASEFKYHMIIPSSRDEAREKFEEIEKVPILLFFEKGSFLSEEP